MSKNIKVEYRPYDHTGMRISFSGMMSQVKHQLEVFEKIKEEYTDEATGELDDTVEYGKWGNKGLHADLQDAIENMTSYYSFTVSELMDHFKIMGEHFSKGELSVVDNILQLWCLKDKKPGVKYSKRPIGPRRARKRRFLV